MRLSFLLFAVVSLSVFSSWLSASENAVVVVNNKSASSKLIANHYISLRNIPAENVIYLSGIPQREVITIGEFRNKILQPLAAKISQRKINPHIDYIIYSSGFPTIVNAKSDRKLLLESNNKNSQVAANHKLLNPYVSLTSATFFLNSVLRKQPSYLSMSANTYSRAKLNVALTNPFVGDDADDFEKALSSIRSENFDEAIETLSSLAKRHPLQLAVLYWLARAHAWNDDSENAISWLKRCVAIGWCYRDYTIRDSAFKKLKDNDDFKALTSIIANLPARYAPTMSFRNGYLWGQNGLINSSETEGNRYILSTMLAINRNQGNSERETLDYLKTSVQADGSKPNGTFYFTKTRDVRTTTRDKGIDEAVEELKRLGFKTEVVTTGIPQGKRDVIGLTMGAANFKWPASNQIVPGAICENLTSFGGRLMPGAKQTKLTEFLRHGAAGSSGTVIEPFAIQAKFPHPRIHVHYVKGCTLAESFYQSVSGPFQLLIVGDGLCQPWADVPKIVVAGDLKSGKTLKGKIQFEVQSVQSKKPVRLIEMYINGRLVRKINSWQSGRIELDTSAMPDGYHEFRFVGIASGTIQTRGSIVIPVVVNNQGRVVSLKPSLLTAKIDDQITFSVKAEGAEEIQLVHNSRVLISAKNDKARMKVAAHKFGRGPVSVLAEAKYGNETVRSKPIQLSITGEILSTIPVIKSPPKKAKPAKPKSKASK